MKIEKLPTLGEHEAFYGYIVGLGIESNVDSVSGKIGTRFYASFAYGGETKVWLVPDPELFKLLSDYLCGMVRIRWDSRGDDYGYGKLWIKKVSGKWNVQLP
jgi:hypothetical protein